MDRLLFYHMLLFGACGYALLRGRTDARIVALVFLAGDFATTLLRSHLPGDYSSVETSTLLIDVLAFAGFTYAALISDRFWPLWVSGLQLTTSMGHVLKAIDQHMLPLAYAAALRFWAYPILIILLVGTWRAQRRSKRETAAA
jgi:Zn-dependent protease with chaperone function